MATKKENSGERVDTVKNLTPFPPGTSGNPAGRPKGAKTGLRARMMQILDKQAATSVVEALEKEGIVLGDRDNAAVIAAVVSHKAAQGDMQAVKILAEQTELPHPKDVKLSGDFSIVIEAADANLL